MTSESVWTGFLKSARETFRVEEKESFEHRIGNLHEPDHRNKAISKMETGGAVFMITGNEIDGVGGIFFDINNPDAVKTIVRIKSTPEKTRQSLFAIMTPDEDFDEIVDLRYPVNIKDFSPPCFLRVPVKHPDNFPEWAKFPGKDGIIKVQCFPSDRLGYFGEFVREARKKGITVGGTSLNLSGQGNFTNIADCQSLFYLSGSIGYWLESGVQLTGVSFSIWELLSGNTPKVIEQRKGNVSFERAETLFQL